MPSDGREPSSAFLINDYKLSYLLRRLPQTFLGGVKLRFANKTPPFIITHQMFLLLYPLLLSGVFTVLFELEIVASELLCTLLFSSALLVVSMVIALSCLSVTLLSKYKKADKRSRDAIAEEEEFQFVSWFGMETMEFLFNISKPKLYYIFHPLVGAAACGLSYTFLLPSRLQEHFGSYSISIPVYVFGWLAVCIAHYATIAKPPPEPATFRSSSVLHLDHIMRSVYVIAIGIIGVCARTMHANGFLQTADLVLHVVLPFLPIFWCFGLLPPLDALLPWIFDQLIIHAFGGSPAASDLRSAVSLFLCGMHFVLMCLINDHITGIVVIACSGCVMSLDVVSFMLYLLSSFLERISTIGHSYNLNESHKTVARQSAYGQSPFQRLIKYTLVAFNVIIGGVLAGLAVTGRLILTTEVAAIVVVAVFVIFRIVLSLQSAYIMFGLVRNPFIHPTKQPRSSSGVSFFFLIKLIHIGLLRSVMPLLCILAISSSLTTLENDWVSWLYVLSVVRLYRKVWQDPNSCAQDIIIVYFVTWISPSDTWLVRQPISIRIFLVAFLRSRSNELLRKLWMVGLISYHALTNAKQRHRAVIPSLAITWILFPLFAVCLSLAVALSAPLLPLFTLPLFIVGYPRPQRFWPAATDEQRSANNDWIYYDHMMPSLLRAFHSRNAAGSFGCLSPGDGLLARFQDRLIWLTVAETGLFYCNVIVKGLELQETSCHTVEAARIDEIFEGAFSNERTATLTNPYIDHVLLPRDVLMIRTYSDARSVLTGIIDQPDTRKKVSKMFLKTLTWIMLHYCKEKRLSRDVDEGTLPLNGNYKDDVSELTFIGSGVHPTVTYQTPKKKASDSNVFQVKTSAKSVTSTADLVDNEVGVDIGTAYDEHRTGYGLPAADQHSTKCVGIKTSLKHNAKEQAMRSIKINIGEDSGDGSNEDEFDDFGFGDEDADGGSSVSLRKLSSLSQCQDTVTSHRKPPRKVSRSRHQTNSPSTLSNHIDVPAKWKEVFDTSLSALVPMTTKFPVSWYKFILESFELHLSDKSLTQNALLDQGVMSSFYQLVIWCHYMIEFAPYTEDTRQQQNGAGHVVACYQGDLPWSMHLYKLDEDQLLRRLVVKAYRYAFKIVYDECVVGEIEDFSELSAAMSQLDSEWYLGNDISKDWNRAIDSSTSHLLSIGHDPTQGTYTSRLLTMQQLPVCIGTLQPEVIRSLWSSLALELIYVTNDDEERYSIQAHPALLRNITIQAADPPLGYPVFSSGLTCNLTW